MEASDYRLEDTPAGRAGKVAVLTRPAGQSEALAARLQAVGWQVADWPALALSAVTATRVPLPKNYDIVMFVSGNAVRFYAAQLAATGNAGWPAGVRAATVGPASAAAVAAQFGAEVPIVHPPLTSPGFDSEALWRELTQGELVGVRVLIVRGGEGEQGQGRPWLASRLTQAGADVTLHAAYRRRPARWPAQRLEQIAAWRAAQVYPVWFVSSSEGVGALTLAVGDCAIVQAWRGCRVVVPHERVAQAVNKCARSCGIVTTRPDEGEGVDSARIMLKLCMPHDSAVLEAIVN